MALYKLHLVVLKDKPNFEYSKIDFEQVMIPNMVYDLLILCEQEKHIKSIRTIVGIMIQTLTKNTS